MLHVAPPGLGAVLASNEAELPPGSHLVVYSAYPNAPLTLKAQIMHIAKKLNNNLFTLIPSLLIILSFISVGVS